MKDLNNKKIFIDEDENLSLEQIKKEEAKENIYWSTYNEFLKKEIKNIDIFLEITEHKKEQIKEKNKFSKKLLNFLSKKIYN
jgi:hypothetical protein